MKKRASEFSNVGEIIKFIKSEKEIKINYFRNRGTIKNFVEVKRNGNTT